jgi:hypothetical protein
MKGCKGEGLKKNRKDVRGKKNEEKSGALETWAPWLSELAETLRLFNSNPTQTYSDSECPTG